MEVPGLIDGIFDFGCFLIGQWWGYHQVQVPARNGYIDHWFAWVFIVTIGFFRGAESGFYANLSVYKLDDR